MTESSFSLSFFFFSPSSPTGSTEAALNSVRSVNCAYRRRRFSPPPWWNRERRAGGAAGGLAGGWGRGALADGGPRSLLAMRFCYANAAED